MMSIHRAGKTAMLCIGLGGCASASDGSDPPDQNETGEISLAIERVPDNVSCLAVTLVLLNAPPPYGGFISRQIDVTPGGSAHIRFASLRPGEGDLTGTAYPTSCANSSLTGPTWIADSAHFLVQWGHVTAVQLNFHPFGGVDVGVNFDTCTCDGFNECTMVNRAGDTVRCQPLVEGGIALPSDGGTFD